MIIEERIIDADFRNPTVTALRDEADIICTNPPFSLFREFIKWINPDEKQFIVIGSIGAICYKDIFPLIKNNKLWLGIVGGAKEYIQPDGTLKKMGNTCWFTNIVHNHRITPMVLLPKSVHEANGAVYQKYDNYDAIEVPELKLLPSDYSGVMGVPISFLDRYNPDQFEIITCACGNSWANYKDALISLNYNDSIPSRGGTPVLDGKLMYTRILIRKKTNS